MPDRDGCGCPERDDAVLAAAPDAGLSPPVSDALSLAISTNACAVTPACRSAWPGIGVAFPVPKLPPHQALCVLRC
jgi:hypothetical protein